MTSTFALAQLRHAYHQLYVGVVVDQRGFAEGLLGPAIAALETDCERRQATGVKTLSAMCRTSIEYGWSDMAAHYARCTVRAARLTCEVCGAACDPPMVRCEAHVQSCDH